MPRLFRLLFLAALFVCVAAHPGTSAAQDRSVKVAVIDVQLVMRDAVASKSVRSQFERQREVFQEEIQRQEDELRELDKSLAQQRAVLSNEAFAEKQKEFQQRVADTQRQVQSRKRQLDEGLAAGLEQVQRAIAEVAREIAAQRGADLVLSKNMAIFASPSLDITQEALERLNRHLPEVTVTFPSE